MSTSAVHQIRCYYDSGCANDYRVVRETLVPVLTREIDRRIVQRTFREFLVPTERWQSQPESVRSDVLEEALCMVVIGVLREPVGDACALRNLIERCVCRAVESQWGGIAREVASAG